MLDVLLRFLGMFAAGITAGIALCVLLVDRRWKGTGQFYTQLMQLLNRALTIPAPALGALGLVAMASDTVLMFERGGAAVWCSAGAVALAVVALAITKLGHFPINDRVLGWDAANPPAEWTAVRARWSAFHLARTLSALGSFVLFMLGGLQR